MYKKLLFVLIAALTGVIVLAQEADRPQRTPQEEAKKQTERLIRELGIKDSLRIDTIYKMHLKYARLRQKGLSRKENMDRMNAIYSELEKLLTPEEFNKFMNHPAEQPRRPRGANVMIPKAVRTDSSPAKPATQTSPR